MENKYLYHANFDKKRNIVSRKVGYFHYNSGMSKIVAENGHFSIYVKRNGEYWLHTFIHGLGHYIAPLDKEQAAEYIKAIQDEEENNMKLIDVLKETVAPALAGRNVMEIGSKLYVKLDDVRRIELSLETAGYADNYEIILMKLVSKTNGELNKCGLKFKNVIGAGKVVTSDYQRGYCWRSVTQHDLTVLRKAVFDYISMWE